MDEVLKIEKYVTRCGKDTMIYDVARQELLTLAYELERVYTG